MSSNLLVFVPGIPATQGSIKSYGPGRMVHSNKRTLPWRELVAATVRKKMHTPEHADTVWPLTGPVGVSLGFWLPRPKSAPKQRVWPEVKPDLDKLVRAVFDALDATRGAGVIVDDAQIVKLAASKAYGVAPGVEIRVTSMPATP